MKLSGHDIKMTIRRLKVLNFNNVSTSIEETVTT